MNVHVKIGANTYFMYSLATTTEKFNANIMATKLIPTVEELDGAEYVFLFVSDNTSSCVKAKSLVSAK